MVHWEGRSALAARRPPASPPGLIEAVFVKTILGCSRRQAAIVAVRKVRLTDGKRSAFADHERVRPRKGPRSIRGQKADAGYGAVGFRGGVMLSGGAASCRLERKSHRGR